MSKKNVLNVKNMNVSFKSHGQEVKAVRGVSFSVDQGEIVGLVGESGSGKSVTMKAVMGILPDNAERTAESILLNERELKDLSDEECRKVRGKEMTMIFQDPMTALNPLKKIGSQIEEVIIRQKKCSKNEAKEKALEMLKKVGIPNPEVRLGQYPHEFSGGQRQRIGIARALCLQPKLIVCDEPVSALDVSVQAQIINMMMEIQQKYGMAYLFISHDLSVVKHISDRIMVMYLGKIVEIADKAELYKNPLHPYSKALLSAIPIADPTIRRDKIILDKEINFNEYKEGCRFADRCWMAKEDCHCITPELKDKGNNHYVACHYI